MLDHLPRVVGWRYEHESFVGDGTDWVDKTNPACAFNKTWAELNIQPNTMTVLECNEWLEAGNRIESWLPDLPTTHDIPFDPPKQPTRAFGNSYVLFHLAGWGDVPDGVFLECMEMFPMSTNVYIVGGSYDGRPDRLYKLARRKSVRCQLLTDLEWADMYSLIKDARWCFGHESGFTTLCDVLGTPTVIKNISILPGLYKTWNNPDHDQCIYTRTTDQWQAAVVAAADTVKQSPIPNFANVGSVHDYVRFASMERQPESVYIATKTDAAAAAFVNAMQFSSSKTRSLVVDGTVDTKKLVAKQFRNTMRKPVVATCSGVRSIPPFTTFDLVIADGLNEVDLKRLYAATRNGGMLIHTLKDFKECVPVDALNKWFVNVKVY